MSVAKPNSAILEGESPTARNFGAKVELKKGSLAMCLVVARASPLAAINAVGAKILAQLSATRVIAVVDMTLLGQLQRHPDVVTAGSVSVDPERFGRFQSLVGVRN